MQNILILHNLRSAENVGAIFRTADAVGINQIYLTGYTPAPIDRFGRARQDVSKSALGAEQNIPWEEHMSLELLIDTLHKDGFQIVAIEQQNGSTDYKDVSLKEKNCFILGNETEGIPEKILSMSDVVAEIPMFGKKESLNVSVAAGVALFRILDK